MTSRIHEMLNDNLLEFVAHLPKLFFLVKIAFKFQYVLEWIKKVTQARKLFVLWRGRLKKINGEII